MDLKRSMINNHLYLRELDINSIAKKYGTPIYLYDLNYVRNRVAQLRKLFNKNINIYYAVKANYSYNILNNLRGLVDGLDVSSGGELNESLAAGYSANKLSFAGPGKTDAELSQAIDVDVGIISVESLNELTRIEAIAKEKGKIARVSIRINPIKIHKNFAIKMGGKSSQFGIDEETYPLFFDLLKKCDHCKFIGIHVYTGTQCLDEETLIDNVKNVLLLTKNICNTTGYKPKVINFGGGFGVPLHKGQKPFDLEYVCRNIQKEFDKFIHDNSFSNIKGVFEFGRYIMAQSGIYITKVIDKKISRGKIYCILDGGMNHHLPASGNFGQIVRKNYLIKNINRFNNSKNDKITFVGPTCTSIDVMGSNVEMEEPEIGDFIAFLNSGAYGYSVSPLFFLSHETPLELLAEGNSIDIIRKTYSVKILRD